MPLTAPRDIRPEVAELETLGLFGALDDIILSQLADRLAVSVMAQGDLIYQEGERGRVMYVVLEGEVELVKKSGSGQEIPVSKLRQGDWFGELALLDVMPRAVTARASQAGRLLELRSTDLDALYRSDLKAYALLVMNLARQLSRKLRVAETVLANATPSALDADVSPASE